MRSSSAGRSVKTSSTQPCSCRFFTAAGLISASTPTQPAITAALPWAPLMPPRPLDTYRAPARGCVAAPAQVEPARAQDRDGGAVDDALGPDVHVAAGGHLPVAGHAQGGHAGVVVAAAVVGDDHAVGHHHPGRVPVAGEQAQGMARIDDQGLLVGHLGQVLHGQQVLGPVLEDGAVAAVGDQLVGVLGHRRIQVVLDHQHDGRGLGRARRVLIQGAGVHPVGRPEAVHVDAAPAGQLGGEFRRQLGVQDGREVAQGVAQGQAPLGRAQQQRSGRRAADGRVVRRHGRQVGGDAPAHIRLEVLVMQRGAHGAASWAEKGDPQRNIAHGAGDSQRGATRNRPSMAPVRGWETKIDLK